MKDILARKDYYILEGRNIREANLLEWSKYFQNADRKIKHTAIGDVEISTVFLGMNCRFGHGEPLLFETMIFGGEHDQYCERYSTYDEAEKGHEEAINLVLKAWKITN